MPHRVVWLSVVALAGCVPKVTTPEVVEVEPPADLAVRGEVVDQYGDVEVADPYRWLEPSDTDEVVSWTETRNAAFGEYTDALGQRTWLYDRFQKLWRYDDESTPSPCLLSDRIFYRTKEADQDKWVVHMRANAEDEKGQVVLDPNTWEATQTLAQFSPSPDCRYAVYGMADAGNEDPELFVLDLDTLEVMDDTVRGWKRGGISWKHDNSGFFYSGKPLEGEVPEGEHFYWHRGWFHALGTSADDDELVVFDDESKETWNGVGITEGGRWAVQYRSIFNKNALWLMDLEGGGEPVPMTTDMDAEYNLDVVDDTVIITTDWEAPRYRVMVTSVDEPEREHWKELIPQSDDTLSYVAPIAGKLFAVYQHNAHTRIAVYTLEGEHLHDLELPTMGSAGVWGFWSKPDVWVSFSSFAHPSTVYTYEPESRDLALYKEPAIPIEPEILEQIGVEQVWYPSKDGTQVSMFVIRHKDAPKDGSVPFLLTGYGGFNISMRPSFRTSTAVWIQAGGGVAIPNLRGGGEYGVEWHEAGMRDRKQNVFDDFIAAAEYLVGEGYTASDRLAIAGGSNGGLLVSAAVTQRPELFQAVLCQVPLTDMVRFHHFGLANIWSEEYGNADDPEMFPHIYAYSPYHNVEKGVDYPAILVTGSVNDARTDPAHARKFAAAVRWADSDFGMEEPILLHIQSDSGHGGGVTIDTRVDQTARHYGFLMSQVGLVPVVEDPEDPEATPASVEPAEATDKP